MEESTVSKSKQKREERAASVAKKKRENLIWKIVGIVVGVALIGLIAFGIVRVIIKEANTIAPSSDYSAQLDDNGFIKGVRALDYVTLCDYKNMVIPESEVTYTDEEFQNVIKQNLENHQVLSDEGTVKDGDKVNIDYVGSIDGVEFEGGNSGGAGYDLTIGSNQFIEGFESQLIGHSVGEEFTIDVTFPEDYGKEDLAGKPAQFDVTIHGIYVDPEYNDDFVKEYYPEMGSTVAEYEQSLKDTHRESSIHDYVETHVVDDSTVIKYPKKYYKQTQATTKYADVESYQYMSQMYQQYGMDAGTFEDYIGKSDEEYDADVIDRSQKFVKSDLVYQAILENEGVTLTADEAKTIVDEMFDGDDYYQSNSEEHGKGYVAKEAVKKKAVDIALKYATVK